MKIYISHPSSYDYVRELYEPIKHSDLYVQYEFFLPHESHNVAVSAQQVLRTTDLLVAEVSLPSTGQGIELGLATAAQVPIICFYRAGTKPSKSLESITKYIQQYTDADGLLRQLRYALETM